jgi:hypothetical protein
VTPDVQVFLYPEELAATEPDALAEQVLELGCDAVSVAVAYHRGRRVLPRQRRVSVLTETTLYFPPDRRRYGALVPAANGPSELRDALFRFRESCDRAGLRFRAWIVSLHHDRLAAESPDAAAQLLDGGATGVGLCPSAPAAVEYVAALVADVCAQLEPELAELEAALYPAWEPAYTLTLALEPPSEQARLAWAQCFCESCRALFGPRADELAARVRGGAWDDELVSELVAVRAAGGERVIAAAAAAAHAHGSNLRVFSSGPPQQAALQGLSPAAVAPADRLLLGCGPLHGDELLARFRSLRALVDDRPATASTNWTPERPPRELAADAERLAGAGADGLALYNLSLVPEAGLAAFRAAAAAFRAAAPVAAP